MKVGEEPIKNSHGHVYIWYHFMSLNSQVKHSVRSIVINEDIGLLFLCRLSQGNDEEKYATWRLKVFAKGQFYYFL